MDEAAAGGDRDCLLLACSRRLTAVETGSSDTPVAVVNAAGPITTRGTEFIARLHRDDLDVILSHMFLWATESAGAAVVRLR